MCGSLNSRVSLETQNRSKLGGTSADSADSGLSGLSRLSGLNGLNGLNISTSKELSRTLACKGQSVVSVAADARVRLGDLPVPALHRPARPARPVPAPRTGPPRVHRPRPDHHRGRDCAHRLQRSIFRYTHAWTRGSTDASERHTCSADGRSAGPTSPDTEGVSGVLPVVEVSRRRVGRQ